ncbi:NADH flavin oxidoreductase/NADH oxidase [Ceratobasidium theobromae]|uniref:NADH flavin oxidoreductase/NADH oxidase n=1 Tax=Ceratobasidium theobromae TaxID=1582974 RepID=A0A5N5QLM8_9AGAM|nr:NADH flavin oxidoreductase/NADH oxidase [Ceratobasidium theobromae]
MATSSNKLFSPLQLGEITLGHRVIMAPLTRFRADDNHVHTDLAVEYYAQRASVPGTLLITEATFIAPEAGGFDHVPGIWNDEQIVAWKKVTDAVHDQHSYIYLQLWALGRAAEPKVLAREGLPYVSSSPTPMEEGGPAPRELTKGEIAHYVDLYVQAARNAIKAGFDGVEIHSANGYLLDQFLQDTCNKRTDEYGGSIENRARFTLQVADAVTAAVGAKKTGLRLSPWGMRMKDPVPTFSYVVKELAKRHTDLAYLHVVEPVVSGDNDAQHAHDTGSGQKPASNDFAREIWGEHTFLSAGGYNAKSAEEVLNKFGNSAIVFGRHFIANPDLPVRLRTGVPLTRYDRSTFYTPGPKGYIDYPRAGQVKASGDIALLGGSILEISTYIGMVLEKLIKNHVEYIHKWTTNGTSVIPNTHHTCSHTMLTTLKSLFVSVQAPPAPDDVVPVSINWFPNRRCNYECSFCFHTSKNTFILPLDQAKEALRALADAGMRKLNISGGEPFMNPTYIGEVFKFCKEELKIESNSVVTNSSKITEKWLDEYGQYLDIMAISCDTFNIETDLKHKRAEKGKPTHIKHVFDVVRWCKARGIGVKLNSVITKYNYDEDMNASISELAPFRWKVFQVLVLDGENNGTENGALRDARDLLITKEQFQSFLDRHKEQKCLVPEDNDTMKDSYLLIDEEMRFLDCSGGGKIPGRSILKVGVHQALQDAGFDQKTFVERGGVFDWTREAAVPPSLDW